MSIDLRTERTGGTWTRRFGDHEQQGFEVSISRESAHVTLTAHGILFAIDRRDIPAAWDKPIDVVKLRAELIAAIVRHMSVEVLEDLFREIHSQRQTAFRNGQHATQTTLRKALGL
jgi:hypothetical protein